MNVTIKTEYVRVSLAEQNKDWQLVTMINYELFKLFSEKRFTKNKEALKFVREDDTIVIHDFSRLARSINDLLKKILYPNNKKVALVSTKENIDNNTAIGKLILTIIWTISEFERTNLIKMQII